MALVPLPAIEAEDAPGLRVVFRFLEGRVQDPRQEVETRARPGTDDWTLRRVGIRGEPFALFGLAYTGPGPAQYELRRRIDAMQGRVVRLYRDETQTPRRCCLLQARYAQRLGLLRISDPYAGGEGVPLNAVGMLGYELTLLALDAAAHRNNQGF